ncbi:MAG: DUF4179 domain-containing protein [Anaerolineae bacterium]|nr:DUF4179 domain-containing protein [Anaerolineae bacterium]
MDEREFSQLLLEIAEREVPDTMDIYPEVQERLRHSVRRAARSRVSWTLIAAILMLVMVVAVYAVDQLLQAGDPGLEGADAVNLITRLDLSQTIDGVTVSLDYAYADANRVTVGYTIRGMTDAFTSYVVTQTGLKDGLGRGFNPLFGQSDALPNIDVSQGDGQTPFEVSGSATYDGCLIEGEPETVRLQFQLNMERWIYNREQVIEGATMAAVTPIATESQAEIDATATAFFATIAPTQTAYAASIPATLTQSAVEIVTLAPTLTAVAAQPPTNCGGYGGGGGGGGGPIERIEPVGPFVFDFSVPFIPAQVYEQPLTAEANGLPIRIERVTITPSFTRLRYCFTPPDDNFSYYENANVHLTIGDQAFDFSPTDTGNSTGMGSYSGFGNTSITVLPAPADAPPDCREMLLNESLYDLEGEWTLSLESMSTQIGGMGYGVEGETAIVDLYPSPQIFGVVAARLAERLPEYPAEDVTDARSGSRSLRIDVPLDEIEALQPVFDEILTQRLDGPWVFTFTPR